MMRIRRGLFAAVVTMGCLAGPASAAEGDVSVRDAWARATPPGMSVAAAYMTIVGGAHADRLIGATTERAGMTQIHVVTEAEGMARMRPVEGVDVPSHKSVVLAPQGLHLMLMNLSRPLVAGEHFPLTLTFARAGKLDVDIEVRAPDETPPHAH